MTDLQFKLRATSRARRPEARTHERSAIDGVLFAAELTQLCARERGAERAELVLRALSVVRDPELYAAIEHAVLRACCQCELDPQDAQADSMTGTLALCAWTFVSAGDTEARALLTVLRLGGDSARAGALVTGWLRVLHAEPQTRAGFSDNGQPALAHVPETAAIEREAC